MSNLTSDFFENEEQALRRPVIVLRDSLGALAIQILSEKEDIANLQYNVLLSKLNEIISELNDAYERSYHNFN